MLDSLLNTNETARILGISKFTVRAWVYQRKLPFVRLGRRILFSKEALESFVKRNEVEAKQ